MAPLILTDDPTLAESLPDARSSAVVARHAPAEITPQGSLDARIRQMIARGQEDSISSVLKSSSLEEINCVADSTWEQMVPVLLSWTNLRDSEQEIMSFSIAYHMMDSCPEVLQRLSVVNYIRRFASVCDATLRSNRDMSAMGGLSVAELATLTRVLKQI